MKSEALKALSAYAALLLLAAACGSSPEGQSASTSIYRPQGAKIPPCASAVPAIKLPKGFPTDFPLPPGTAITSHKIGLGHEVDVSGYVPARSFTAAASYFSRRLPQRGYKVTHYEADPGRDSEGNFRGHGYTGGWSVRVIPGCAAMRFAAGAIKTHH